MNRDEAISIVLAEAFADNGLVVMAHQGDDPGFQRMETLISAIDFLADDLSRENTFDRALVSALFSLATHVPEDFHRSISPLTDSRCSLHRQSVDLVVAITMLIENWEHWPDQDQLPTYELGDFPDAGAATPCDEAEFEGYRVGDVTYCVVQQTDEFFPVRVVRLGFNVIEVNAVHPEICRHSCATFLDNRLNRCFQSPSLPALARFGGFDERPVNAARKSGPELRLLPAHYATKTGQVIMQRHAEDPKHWPLPTGTVYERWFKDAN